MGDHKRIQIPKKMRFEVFKRDKFTCQYCGRKSPDVVLEVDHIKPVAEGGTNDILNLVTACFDCNRGKSKTLLDDSTVIQKQQAQLELLAEKREQLAMMLEWRSALSNTNDEVAEGLLNYLFGKYGSSLTKDKAIRAEAIRYVKKSWLRFFTVEELLNAIDIASEQYNTFSVAVEKVGGICYNKRRDPKTAEKFCAYLDDTMCRCGVDEDVCDEETLNGIITTVGNAMVEGLISYGTIETILNAFSDDPGMYVEILNTFAKLYKGGRHGN